MAFTKSVEDIIKIQNSCRGVMSELYEYHSRPNALMRQTYKNAKIDDAIGLDIIEYDSFDDELSLSVDTFEYYQMRLGHNSETTIGSIDEKLQKLKLQLSYYNQRIMANESPQKELRSISKLLQALPTLLRHNLYAITSNSIFAFKNEPNYDIKMQKLEVSKGEIEQLVAALESVSRFLKEQKNFFKSMRDNRINALVLKINKNALEFEYSFQMLYEDIKKFINQSIKDGEFIKKLQHLRELKQNNELFSKTDIEEKALQQKEIIGSVKERKIHPDDRVFDYIDTIEELLKARKVALSSHRESQELSYDIDEEVEIEKTLFNYPKLHKAFLSQDEDLATFLYKSSIKDAKLLGVFVRLLKHYFKEYDVQLEEFVEIQRRRYVIVRSKK